MPTRAEALAILTGTPASFRAAVALGSVGLRVGEVLGLTADRIVIDKRRVTIDRQMQRYGGRAVLTTPKAEKVRTITLPALVAVELRRHLRVRVYAHWLRDDRDVPAAVLDRELAPGDALRAHNGASDAGS